MKFKIYKNERRGPDDFEMQNPCEFCDRFAEYVYAFCKDVNGLVCLTGPFVCKSCLNEAIAAIDAAILED